MSETIPFHRHRWRSELHPMAWLPADRDREAVVTDHGGDLAHALVTVWDAARAEREALLFGDHANGRAQCRLSLRPCYAGADGPQAAPDETAPIGRFRGPLCTVEHRTRLTRLSRHGPWRDVDEDPPMILRPDDYGTAIATIVNLCDLMHGFALHLPAGHAICRVIHAPADDPGAWPRPR